MTLLIAGVILWSALHLMPAVAAGLRQRLVDNLGNSPYRGLFALGIIAAMVLMVLGWRSTQVHLVYVPPLYGSAVVTVLMLVSFALIGAANAPCNIKRFLRHPMLTGTALWGAAHLLANGDNRSIVLFGGLGLWALVSIVAINHRDGEWQRPGPVPLIRDALTIAGSIVVFAVMIFLHPHLFGVSPLPGL